ncbi:MAG: MBL fold metallo-hydrolase [Bacteroidetes bacterium]|nr:MBL fold metallo-hydrolase [Bacteroidota bacterium]
MSVFALPEGSYTIAQDKVFVPFNIDTDDMKDRPASLLIEIQPFLIELKNDLLLCDTGLGYLNEQGEMTLFKNIKRHGFVPENITKVLLSHLHFDHVGGAVQKTLDGLQLSFPNAIYYVQRGEYERAVSHASKSYRIEIIETLYHSGKLILLDGDGKINDEISYEITGGHTEFHQAYTIKNQDEIYFFGGDVLPDLYQLMRKFVAKYDYDGKTSAEKRVEFGNRSIEQNSILLFYHSIKVPLCKIMKTEVGFRRRL